MWSESSGTRRSEFPGGAERLVWSVVVALLLIRSAVFSVIFVAATPSGSKGVRRFSAYRPGPVGAVHSASRACRGVLHRGLRHAFLECIEYSSCWKALLLRDRSAFLGCAASFSSQDCVRMMSVRRLAEATLHACSGRSAFNEANARLAHVPDAKSPRISQPGGSNRRLGSHAAVARARTQEGWISRAAVSETIQPAMLGMAFISVCSRSRRFTRSSWLQLSWQPRPHRKHLRHYHSAACCSGAEELRGLGQRAPPSTPSIRSAGQCLPGR